VVHAQLVAAIRASPDGGGFAPVLLIPAIPTTPRQVRGKPLLLVRLQPLKA
jgi:hypothetical protein